MSEISKFESSGTETPKPAASGTKTGREKPEALKNGSVSSWPELTTSATPPGAETDLILYMGSKSSVFNGRQMKTLRALYSVICPQILWTFL